MVPQTRRRVRRSAGGDHAGPAERSQEGVDVEVAQDGDGAARLFVGGEGGRAVEGFNGLLCPSAVVSGRLAMT